MRVWTLLAVILVSLAGWGKASAQQWDELGPNGGFVSLIAAGPPGSAKVFLTQGSRVFASADNGGTWVERAPLPECPSPLSLQVRADGDVFINCYHRNVRSRDDARTWSSYSPPVRLLVDFTLAFDPTDNRRAALRRGEDFVWRIATTSDDGVTWTSAIPGPDDVVPTFVAFDPNAAGRLVGVATESRLVDSRSEYQTRIFDSRDGGAHWTPRSTIVPRSPVPCYEREFLIDPAGRFFLLADCGLWRSRDSGLTWELMPGMPDVSLSQLQVDRANPNRLLAFAPPGQLYESRDAAASWQLLPANGAGTFAYATGDRLFGATSTGVFALEPGSGTWVPRSQGIHTRALGAVEPAGGSPVILNALESFSRTSMLRSIDGGITWMAATIDGRVPVAMARNLTDASAVLASMADGALYASADGGVAWTQVNPRPSTSPDDRVGSFVSVGPQPGLVYGLVYQPCPAYALLPPSCTPVAQGVARSVDGGKSWTRVAGGPPVAVGQYTYRIVPSAVTPSTFMVVTTAGVYVTRDSGSQFDLALPTFALVIADRIEADRWYAIDAQRKLLVTTDAGKHWLPLTGPPSLSGQLDLLADPYDARKLYTVGTRGDVSASSDRGVTWAMVVPPALSLDLTPTSARIGPESATTIYAAGAQGVVRVTIASLTAPAVARAVEYYRPGADHYFMTADPVEIARLDSGATAGWLRTGFGFDVLAASASDPFVSPVCRFYGKPEKGLDSHFYSAAPAECLAVRERFSDAWIYESPVVFRTYLPSIDGTCPSRTTPVYRVYNQRADVNHRYTMWPELRGNMIDAGWIPEGYGPYGVAMCVPWLT